MAEKKGMSRVLQVAGDVAHVLGEAAQTTGEQFTRFQQAQRLEKQMRALGKERERCKATIVDLVLRMFDQDAFTEALLRPEYLRIREIDGEMARLQAARAALAAEKPHEVAPASPIDEEALAPLEADAGITAGTEPAAELPVKHGDIEEPTL